MNGITRFKAGELEREIGVRGLTHGEFAKIADLDLGTLSKATKGLVVRPKTFGKILAALGRTPVLHGAESLLERRSA
jgi:predicted transcriptional regulator